jgi:hypothetical protein
MTWVELTSSERLWLTLSNMAFAVAPITLVVKHRARLTEVQWLYVQAGLGIMLFSWLHHACNAYGRSPECGGTCIVANALHAAVDSIASGMGALVCTLYASKRPLIVVCALFLAPLPAIMMLESPSTTYLAYIASTCAVVVLVRLLLRDIRIDTSHGWVTAAALVLLFVLSLLAGVQLQYQCSLNGDVSQYAQMHTGWHFSMAVAFSLVPLLVTTTGNQHESMAAAVIETQQHQSMESNACRYQLTTTTDKLLNASP